MRRISQAAQACRARDKGWGLGCQPCGAAYATGSRAEMCLKGGSFLHEGVHGVCTAPHSSPPTWPLAPPSWDHHLLCTRDAPITSKLGPTFLPASLHRIPFTLHHKNTPTSTHGHASTHMCPDLHAHPHTLHIQTAATPAWLSIQLSTPLPRGFCPQYWSFLSMVCTHPNSWSIISAVPSQLTSYSPSNRVPVCPTNTPLPRPHPPKKPRGLSSEPSTLIPAKPHSGF